MKKLLGICCIILFPVLFESCYLFGDSCKGDEYGAHSVKDFTLQTVNADKRVYEPAPTSAIPQVYMYVLSLNWQLALSDKPTMGAYADCAPAPAKETATKFSITSDHDLVLADSTLAAGHNLTFVIQTDYTSVLNEPLYNLDYKFTPRFSVPTAQQHDFTFSITLNDGRTFNLKTGTHELLPE